MNRSILLFLPLLLCLTGCASMPDAGDLLPIISAGIGADDAGLKLTAEAVRQDSLEGSASSVYLTAQAEDPDALFKQADRLLADKLYFSHARTFVLDEETARTGLRPLVSSLLTRGDVRLTLRLAVARDVAADEIVRAEAIAEEIPGEALGALLDQQAREGNIPDLPLCSLADALLSGADFSLPALILTEDGRVTPAGQAEFRLGRLTGFTGGETDA